MNDFDTIRMYLKVRIANTSFCDKLLEIIQETSKENKSGLVKAIKNFHNLSKENFDYDGFPRTDERY